MPMLVSKLVTIPRIGALPAMALLLWSLGTTAGCSSKKVVLGEQCPSPASGNATVQGDDLGLSVYGTTCAPCDDGDQAEYDSNGCPVFVTFESCGGDICMGTLLIKAPPTNGGVAADGGEDAGRDDAASDAGNHVGDEDDGGV